MASRCISLNLGHFAAFLHEDHLCRAQCASLGGVLIKLPESL